MNSKPFTEKLTLSEGTSFVARTYRTPFFEVPWHQHIEYELILFVEGHGQAFVGNNIGEFETGDVFFLGANLPHTFQKRHTDLVTSAVVVQFKEDFWGSDFIEIPECAELKGLFDLSMKGLKVAGECKKILNPLIKDLEFASGLKRIVILCECLGVLCRQGNFEMLNMHEHQTLNIKDRDRIDKIIQYTIEKFQSNIPLSRIAEIASMSIPAFCNYFRKHTKKTYIDFLNEIRISHACKLLRASQMNVLQICLDSGFNTLANFNKQFIKFKHITPSQFRKQFAKASEEDLIPGDENTSLRMLTI